MSAKMPRPKLTLYLDVVSPFGYMAFHITRVGMQSFLCLEMTILLRNEHS